MQNVNELSPVSWAYLGDALYELYIRENLIKEGPTKTTGELHQEAIKYVKAEAQARIVRFIGSQLTEEEKKIIKRGRNQKSGHIPTHTNVITYRYSTAWEGLLGYLYLTGREERMKELIGFGYAYLKAEKKEKEETEGGNQG